MFGKRSGAGTALVEPVAPPPAAVPGAEIATRPQKVEPAAARPEADALTQVTGKRAAAAAAARSGPKATPGLQQLLNAQNGVTAGSGAIAQIVREQSDYYHATKTTIY